MLKTIRKARAIEESIRNKRKHENSFNRPTFETVLRDLENLDKRIEKAMRENYENS